MQEEEIMYRCETKIKVQSEEKDTITFLQKRFIILEKKRCQCIRYRLKENNNKKLKIVRKKIQSHILKNLIIYEKK